VKLRLFAGMTVEVIAEIRPVFPRTIKQNWTYARAWLGHELAKDRDLSFFTSFFGRASRHSGFLF
jgi:hypothetical protein